MGLYKNISVDLNPIPKYWEDHIENKAAIIKSLQDAGGKDCFSFVVMSDLHYPSNLGKLSPAIAKELMDRCRIKYALCLGDVQTRGCHRTKETLLSENEKIEEMLKPIRPRLLQTQGNHDGNYTLLDRDGNGAYDNNNTDGSIKDPTDRESYVHSLTKGEMNGYIYRKVGMVGEVHFDESGTGYWIDDVANKVRYIILNTHNTKYALQDDGTQLYPPMWIFRFQQTQYDMLVDALNSIPDDNWGVVVGGHVPLGATKEWGAWGTGSEAGADCTLMTNLLKAYNDKSVFSGEFVGSGAGGAAYTNHADPTDANWKTGYRFSTSGEIEQDGTSLSNAVTIKKGDTIRFKGAALREGEDRIKVGVTKADGSNSTPIAYFNNGMTIGSESVIVYEGLTDGVYTFTVSSDYTGGINSIRFAMPTPTDPNSIIITVNEEIVETVHGYDHVSVDTDFTNAKGHVVGFFGGHNHADTVTDKGIKIITTRSDAQQENDEALKAERVAGTTTEQSFDVFTVNRAERKIYATKIGAGSDRVITY